MKVKHIDGWKDKEGAKIDYYQVGAWSLELLEGELDEEILAAKHSVKVFKTWHRWLKKEKKRRNK